MTISIYKNTATKSKNGSMFAFGRNADLDGQPSDRGGYAVWALRENYDGQVRGGTRKTWRYVARDLTFAEAVKLMNKRCGYRAFNDAAKH